MKTLIKNGRVVDPNTKLDAVCDILIENKKIIEIKEDIPAGNTRVVDAAGLIVAPGFIDMHVHLREPGQEHKETIASGSAAAARGGFTSIACMPNTDPVNDNSGITQFIQQQARRGSGVNVFPIAAVTLGLAGESITNMAELLEAGAVAFSDDGHPVSSSLVMRRALEYAGGLNALIIDHCEDRELSSGGVMHEGDNSYLFGLKGIPATAEDIMVSRDILLAESSNARVHIAHVSTEGSVELLRIAKEKNLPVTAEVTPHHLLLTDADCEQYDTHFKVNPPLRTRKDRDALVGAVRDGTIDAFATDHAPHSQDEKAVEFDIAPFGINGLETAVSLLLDKFVRTEIISLARFIEMFSTRPAQILGLPQKGTIQPGADADLTFLNLDKNITVNRNHFLSKSRNTPFHGWKLKGTPVMTIVGGKIVFPM